MSAASRPSGGPDRVDVHAPHGPSATAEATPAGHDDTWQLDAARGIVARYRRLFWLVAAPVFVLLVLLAVWQAHQARLALVADLQRRATQHQAALQALARAADEHVKDLRRVVEQELISVPRTPDPAIRDALQQRLDHGRPDGLTLDGLSPLLQLDSAQLLWTDLAQRPDDGVFGRLQALSQTAALAHQRHGDFTWSFHFGWPERHVMVFPWAPTSEFIEALGQKNLQRAVADWFGYEVFTGGTPDKNPLRRTFWTEAYVDAGGRGLMVSHMSPVYSADEFRGVVGADVRLETIATTLRRLTGAETHWWVVSDRGEVLAESHPGVVSGATAASATSVAASAAPPTAVPRIEARLPEGLDLVRLKQFAAVDRAHPVGDWRLVVHPMLEAPWTLVVGETERSLDARVLPTLLPFVLIASGLLAMFIGGQWLVRRRLLDPALAVMAYLAARSRDAAATEPQVGSRWQPWATMVSRIFREQDESRRAERRSEAFKSAIVDNALAAIITTDDDGAIVEFNPAAERLFGQRRAQVLGLQVGEVIVPHRLRAAHVAGMKRMREGGTPRVMGRRLEMSALRADGQEIPIEMVLWRTAVEGVAHYTASIADLSERREQARQIERQRDALRQSEKLTAMGSLLAGVAHELNNPLAIVLGRASLLEEKCADRPDLLGDAQRIRDAAERCGRIVRTFLNMARSRPASRSAVSLNDLAQAAADMLGYTYRSHGIELRLALDASLPTVQADGDQIGQVVLNLLVNAQQVLAGCEGPREVALRTGLAQATDEGSGASVWLRVVDNGPGVPPDLREKIFEPFFTTKPEGIGTGLGLAVSRSLAREHGGELRLEDGAPAQGGTRPGASFLLSLPLAGAAEAPATPMPAVNPPAALDGHAEARTTRVLVVDDESELTDLMRTMLEDAGHEVVTAESGEVALELLSMVEVDVIVSDLRMPDMDGSALWRAVREHHPTLATRMLFVTGDTLSPAARQFLDEARCARLDKPFTREALVAGVAERLAQR